MPEIGAPRDLRACVFGLFTVERGGGENTESVKSFLLYELSFSVVSSPFASLACVQIFDLEANTRSRLFFFFL